MITAQDVSRLAGVSQSAVSRCFTPGASVSSATADKVRIAANALGYRPNILARSLITGKSRIIGLVVGYFDNQFYPDAVEKISRQLQENNYHIMVFMASGNSEDIDPVLEQILDYQVDGLIVASAAMSSNLARKCHSHGIPVVLFNRIQDNALLSTVSANNLAGGEQVAHFLIAGGHQRFAYIAGWEGASTQQEREQGFVRGLKAAGHNLYAREVGDFNIDRTREATLRMFDRSDYPDAVFVANDHMAFAVMDTLRHSLALRVPEDVSVVGYDDVAVASWPSYNLTTISQPTQAMVERTVSIILSRIADNSASPQHLVIDGDIKIRGSARIPEE